MSAGHIDGTAAELAELEAELYLLESLQQVDDAPPRQILPAPRGESVPLSYAQQRLWFMHQLDPANPAYNMPVALRLEGALSPQALARALQEIAGRHESLRTVFPSEAGVPVQRVGSPVSALPLVDLSALSEEGAIAEEMRLARAESVRPFDLAVGPLLRTTLLRSGLRCHALLLTVHHVVSDGWSMEVLVREVVQVYRAAKAGVAPNLPPLPIQYADYALWERQQVASGAHDHHQDFWRQRLAGAPELLTLPMDRARPHERQVRGASVDSVLAGSLAQEVRALARDQGTTNFVVLLATFQLLLHHLGGQDDLVVGTDVANRERPETETLIGFFVNNLALRSRIGERPTFRRYLATVHDSILESFAHQEMPFERVVEALRIERSLGTTPLFQVLFVMQNVPLEPVLLEDLEVSPLAIPVETSKFELGLFITETGDGFVLRWIYQTALFDHSTVRGMAEQFENLLKSALGGLNTPVVELSTGASRKRNMRTKNKKVRFERFKKVKPKKLTVPQAELVTRGFIGDDSTFPRVYQPAVGDVDLVDWAAGNRSLVDEDLRRHGALLFRGFGAPSLTEFERLASALCDRLYGDYGDLPKEESAQKIYKSTPYPPDKTILFHNESSHLNRWPSRQFFHCVKASLRGGETPIVDCREIYKALEPETRRRFEEQGLLYQRNFTDGLDVSWQKFYQTEDRSEVERRCQEDGTEFEWTDQGLRTRQRCQAVIRHPITGEASFFNQIQLHHPSRLDPEVRRSLLEIFGADQLPRDVCFGDGTPIEDSLVDEVTDLYWKNCTAFPWQEGDILMVDNMLVAHARNPFEGARKIVVGMGDMVEAVVSVMAASGFADRGAQ